MCRFLWNKASKEYRYYECKLNSLPQAQGADAGELIAERCLIVGESAQALLQVGLGVEQRSCPRHDQEIAPVVGCTFHKACCVATLSDGRLLPVDWRCWVAPQEAQVYQAAGLSRAAITVGTTQIAAVRLMITTETDTLQTAMATDMDSMVAATAMDMTAAGAIGIETSAAADTIMRTASAEADIRKTASIAMVAADIMPKAVANH